MSDLTAVERAELRGKIRKLHHKVLSVEGCHNEVTLAGDCCQCDMPWGTDGCPVTQALDDLDALTTLHAEVVAERDGLRAALVAMLPQGK